MNEVTQADLLREWVEKEFDDGKDFSKASYKRKSIREFVKNHPELNANEKNIGKHFASILKEVASKKKKAPEEIGVKRPQVNQSMISQISDMDATIEPKPQSPLVGSPQITQPQIQGKFTPEGQKLPVQYDEKGVSATVDAFYLILRSGFAPESELLSDEEKTSLGRMWTPIFQRYFTEDYQVIGVAVIGTAGILIPKLAKGRKIKKEKQAKENVEDKNN